MVESYWIKEIVLYFFFLSHLNLMKLWILYSEEYSDQHNFVFDFRSLHPFLQIPDSWTGQKKKKEIVLF